LGQCKARRLRESRVQPGAIGRSAAFAFAWPAASTASIKAAQSGRSHGVSSIPRYARKTRHALSDRRRMTPTRRQSASYSGSGGGSIAPAEAMPSFLVWTLQCDVGTRRRVDSWSHDDHYTTRHRNPARWGRRRMRQVKSERPSFP
jgi:hypothetical protein